MFGKIWYVFIMLLSIPSLLSGCSTDISEEQIEGVANEFAKNISEDISDETNDVINKVSNEGKKEVKKLLSQLLSSSTLEGNTSSSNSNNTITATIEYVVDGDTIAVKLPNDSETYKVRYLAIDTPESAGPQYEDNPMPYGEEASNFMKSNLPKGSKVNIVFEGSRTDKYGRLLGYVELTDGTDLNALLVNKGLARVAYLYEDYSRADSYKELQSKARNNEAGIWSLNGYVTADGYNP